MSERQVQAQKAKTVGRRRHVKVHIHLATPATDARTVLAARGVDPVAILADMIADPLTVEEDRMRAAIALLPYSAARAPRGRPVTPDVIEAMIEAGRRLVARYGSIAKAIEEIRAALVAETLDTAASRDPDRAATLGQCVRALEQLASHYRAAPETMPAVRVLLPFPRDLIGDGSEPPKN